MTFVSSAVLYTAALTLGALGAGFLGPGWALALSLEGVMLLGGLAGALASHLPVALSLLIAGAAGLGYALLLVFPASRLSNDRVISAVALCGLAAALAMIAARLLGGVSYTRKAYALLLGGENVTVFLPVGIGLALCGWFCLCHTRWGLGLRVCARDNAAAGRAGLPVGRARLAGAAVFGFLGGVAGLAALIALGGGWQLKWGVGGMGLLSLCALRAGKRKPLPVLVLSLLLGLARAGADWAVQTDLGAPQALWPALCFLLAAVLLRLGGSKKTRGSEDENV